MTRWFKYLVREKDLKPGGQLLKNLIEYWHRDTVQTQSATKSDDRPAMMPMFFRNTPKTATAIKTPKRILWQQGEFNIRQAEEQTQTIRSPECDLVIRDVVWKMAEVPFGAAAVTSIAMGFLLPLRPSAVVAQPRDRGEVEDTSGEVMKTIFAPHVKISRTTLPSTSVSRKSRPA